MEAAAFVGIGLVVGAVAGGAMTGLYFKRKVKRQIREAVIKSRTQARDAVDQLFVNAVNTVDAL